MACGVVRKCLGGKIRRSSLEGGGGISQATAMLAELAIAKGSKDSIAIVASPRLSPSVGDSTENRQWL
ncbi:protein-serine/threonine phosphatase [Salvia divinorum]|uniref:Protein-serine/threonine phosphatase n=1 Tax=Salvia divinorum TaxID=28513 RepID=A0ABD1ILH2_SALDI